MRLFTLLALLFSFNQQKVAAQLTANAGPDLSWCYDTNSPVIGGAVVASGGVLPYSYSWTIRNPVTYPSPGIETEQWLLDTPSSIHPRFKNKPRADSVFVYLEVVDAAGSRAYDTTLVRVQSLIWSLGTIPVYKNAADTVRLTEWQRSSNFEPFTAAAWSPSMYLEDSSVLLARCFAPVDMAYRVKLTDRTGCSFDGGVCYIIVNATSVASNNLVCCPQVYMEGDILNIFLPEKSKHAAFQLMDMSGRVILNDRLKTDNHIPTNARLANGIYYYKIFSGSDTYQGKLPVFR